MNSAWRRVRLVSVTDKHQPRAKGLKVEQFVLVSYTNFVDGGPQARYEAAEGVFCWSDGLVLVAEL